MNWLLFADDGAPVGGPPGLTGMLIPLALMFVVMYFLIIMPANRQRKQQQQLLSTLKKGDRVLTSAGILGAVVAIRDEATNEPAEVTLRVDDNTNSRVRVLKSTITHILSRSDESDAAKS